MFWIDCTFRDFNEIEALYFENKSYKVMSFDDKVVFIFTWIFFLFCLKNV